MARRRASRSGILLRWLGVTVICAIAFGYVQPLRAYMKARGRVVEQRAEVDSLLHVENALRRRLEVVGTEAFIEREARRLDLVRPGERLYIVKGIEKWKRSRVR